MRPRPRLDILIINPRPRSFVQVGFQNYHEAGVGEIGGGAGGGERPGKWVRSQAGGRGETVINFTDKQKQNLNILLTCPQSTRSVWSLNKLDTMIRIPQNIEHYLRVTSCWLDAGCLLLSTPLIPFVLCRARPRQPPASSGPSLHSAPPLSSPDFKYKIEIGNVNVDH